MVAWAHLQALGLDQLKAPPNPVKVASEAALWAAVRGHGLLGEMVIVSDGAGQFRVADHALCWVHSERLVYKLQPTNAAHPKAAALARTLIWWFYRDLKAYKRAPDPRRASMLRARFDRISDQSHAESTAGRAWRGGRRLSDPFSRARSD